ncbi:MAG: M17 family peptidase N-terminal domain-containing protein, partial [Novosphingobium sp.]
MQIQFLDASATTSGRLVARLVNQDSVPADLEPVLAEAAKMARFSGKAGQMFEGFAEREGQVVRVVLAGIGGADAKDRKGAIEKAGAAIVAKYLTSGE